MIKFIFIIIISQICSSCTIYYRDASTGAEHIWGIGHLSTKVTMPANGIQTVISRATLTGAALSFDNGSFSMIAGWDCRERITVYDENTLIAIERPLNDDFFLFTIGSTPAE